VVDVGPRARDTPVVQDRDATLDEPVEAAGDGTFAGADITGSSERTGVDAPRR
jgi:hypothetical protein